MNFNYTAMSRRTELEDQIEIARQRIQEAPADTPPEILDLMHKELNSLSFELNNLYDDEEVELPD